MPPEHSTDRSTYRILDASANRAREALRVMEDFTRFVLDDSGLSKNLKELRHDLAGATEPFLAAAIVHRDTAADVGTTLTTPGELSRASAGDVVRAAAKRLTEALRSLEEFTKIDHPASSRLLEAMRYRAYTVEQQLETHLARMGRPTFAGRSLYVLITESACLLPWQTVAEAALAGGARLLQLREKSLDSGELLRRAQWLVGLCRQHDALLIVNDRPDIAVLAGAHGVHVGQGDLPAAAARQIIGQGLLLGISTHSLAQARQAMIEGADYIGVGPVFRSATKPRDILPGLPFANEVAAAGLAVPAYAIAGITLQNLPSLLATGISRIAVTTAITQSANPEQTTRQILALLPAADPAPSPGTGPAANDK
jgi:thiamine-phosphate pyrophosphorylase